MKGNRLILCFRVGFATCCALAADDPVAFVDPFVGTAGTGHTTPAACVPYGLVQAGPDTGSVGWKYCSGYNFNDDRIVGFSQTHLNGTGWMDLGDVRLMPVPADVPPEKAAAFSSRFAKATEKASCGYYAVRLDDAAAKVEASASAHVAIYRIAFDDPRRMAVLVDLQHGFVENERNARNYVLRSNVPEPTGCEIAGTKTTECWVERDCGFVVRFDRPFASCVELPRAEGEKASRYLVRFAPEEKGELLVKVALSAKDSGAARKNLEAEIPGWDFDEVRASARQSWDSVLSRATIEGSEEQKKNWYTSLYHLCIQPNVISDAGDEPYYSTLSCWDTFRAAHPLYTIVDPGHAAQFVKTMLRQGRETGYLPIWTLWGKENQGMIGTHSIPVIVDWYLKTKDPTIDWKSAYDQIKDTLTQCHEGRAKEDWALYDKYGYYPIDGKYGLYRGQPVVGETVSRTLECAYDDACAARMAKALGHDEDAAFFGKRAGSWTNVFDVSTGFVRGRDKAGKWRDPFDPHAFGHGSESANDFTEGNAFQYTWHVLHDPEGLMSALGGKTRAVWRLEALFGEKDDASTFRSSDITGLIGQYVHGNEPSHHVIYCYTLAGRPDLAADRIREVFDRFYLPKPDGLCGNDDCGQMSAWYLFSAMGFYPFDPCGGEYVIGAPQVPRVKVKVKGEGEQWKVFSVVAKGLSKENRYVKSVTLNGRAITDWKIRHADILAGGELVFEMGPYDADLVEKAFAPWVDSGELPGAILVMHDEGREVAACPGYADPRTKRRITLDDPFMQCSQTKGFCGVTVAMLVEEGKLSLDDPVSKYLPEFGTLWIGEPESNGVRRLVRAKNELTVRMVMNHTGGFPFELPAKQPSVRGGGWSGGMPIRSVAAEAAALPILFEPGTAVQYSNTGIDIGAAVVETVTGMKWENFLKERVLDPLDMRDTWFWPTDEQLSRQIEMYTCVSNAPAEYREQHGWQQRPYNDSHVFASAGAGLWTTANDQLKFYKMLMNLGVGVNGRRILAERTVRDLLAKSSRPEGLEGYSLGLAAPVVDSEDAWFGHGGAWGTTCEVNWHRKKLKLWVSQLLGSPSPWDDVRYAEPHRFFRASADKSEVSKYTKRMN